MLFAELGSHNTEMRETTESLRLLPHHFAEVASELDRNGAGQWAGGRFVSVASLTVPNTLAYATHVMLGSQSTPDQKLQAAADLVQVWLDRNPHQFDARRRLEWLAARAPDVNE